MKTQQQVYDYLKENRIELNGKFYPDKELYEASDGKNYRVKFLDKDFIGFGSAFDWLIHPKCKSERSNLPRRISISAKGQLEEVVENFVQGTIQADYNEFKLEKRALNFLLLDLAALGLISGSVISRYVYDNDTISAAMIIPAYILLIALWPIVTKTKKKLVQEVENFSRKKYPQLIKEKERGI